MTSPSRIVLELVPQLERVRPKALRGCPALRNSQSRIRALRHDHERVSREEFEEELRLNQLDRWGEQSEAARICGVGESCLRAWRKKGSGTPLPSRRALDELRERRNNRSSNPLSLRNVGGSK